jgi:hypothetical protein
MVDYLLETQLLLVTSALLLLVYKCHQFRTDSSLFGEALNERADSLAEALNEAGAILDAIAEILEDSNGGGGGTPNPLTQTGSSIGQILTETVLSRMLMPEHGETETNTDGAVHFKDSKASEEPI